MLTWLVPCGSEDKNENWGPWPSLWSRKLGAEICYKIGALAAVVLSKHQRCPEGHKEVGSQAEMGSSH